MSDLLRGEMVHLTAETPETMAGLFTRLNQDSDWARFLDSDPARLNSEKKWKEFLEKDLEKEPSEQISFAIRTLGDDALVGFIGFFDLLPQQGDALVGIGVGDRANWGKGYGTDAMRILLGYGFNELNLRRVSLIVFEYNPRAIRSYEKAGFTLEGRMRNAMLREGERWDFLFMGILREEWLVRQAGTV